jgi:hypothetical protein
MRLRPRTARAKYSAGPKARAKEAIPAAVTISNNVLTTEPKAEPRIDRVSACPASPRSRMGLPSSAVMAADGSPGVLQRIAGIAPEYSDAM